jgi:hypothetical protein
MAHDVFICHSSKDKKIADAICAKLEQSKIRCWIAPRDVVPGSDFAESIVEAIHSARVTVFIFSANSNKSPHVSHELERSVSLGLPILPFRVDDVVPSPALEYFISSAHWLDALTSPMEKHIDKLVSTVAVLLEREVEPPAPTEPPRRRRSRRTIIAAAAGTVAVLAVVAVGLAVTFGGGSDDKGDAGSSGKPSATATPSRTPSGKVTSFLDEFTSGVGAGWAWTNEDKSRWRVTPQGWLEIDSQESPPMHNVLLRDVPGTSYEVKVRLRFPAKTAGFAGLVLMGDDPGTWLEFGLTDEGLSANEYRDGSLVAGTMMYTRDLNVAADRDIRLILTVTGDDYRTRYYNRKYDQFFDLGPERSAFQSTYTRVGLMTYRTTGAAGTAAFDSVEIY